MENLLSYKENSGQSYRVAGSTLGMDHTTVRQAVVNPWRTTRTTFIEIAEFFGMPKDEALKEWGESKIKRRRENEEKFNEAIREGETGRA